MQQLTFHFPIASSPSSTENCILFPGNELAHRYLLRWPDWGNHRFARIFWLSGVHGTGKSFFCQLFAKYVANQGRDCTSLTQASLQELPLAGHVYILEDIDPTLITDETLLHWINRICENNAWLVCTSSISARHFPTTLADLASRLKSLPAAHLELPDDDFLRTLLAKLLTEHQLHFTPEILTFLLKRMERSCAAALQIVELLDQRALALHRNITTTLAREVLLALEEQHQSFF